MILTKLMLLIVSGLVTTNIYVRVLVGETKNLLAISWRLTSIFVFNVNFNFCILQRQNRRFKLFYFFFVVFQGILNRVINQFLSYVLLIRFREKDRWWHWPFHYKQPITRLTPIIVQNDENIFEGEDYFGRLLKQFAGVRGEWRVSHVMDQVHAVSTKMDNDRAGGHCYSFAWI